MNNEKEKFSCAASDGKNSGGDGGGGGGGDGDADGGVGGNGVPVDPVQGESPSPRGSSLSSPLSSSLSPSYHHHHHHPTPPSVCTDPRFVAGRKLVVTGKAHLGAVGFFATLVQESRHKYNDSAIETAPCYYEYGNALFRAAVRRKEVQGEGDGKRGKKERNENDAMVETNKSNTATMSSRVVTGQTKTKGIECASRPPSVVRSVAAEAAEKRLAAAVAKTKPTTTTATTKTKSTEKAVPSVALDGMDEGARGNDDVEMESSGTVGKRMVDEADEGASASKASKANERVTGGERKTDRSNLGGGGDGGGEGGDSLSSKKEEEEEEEVDDAHLALELMENAWSILDRYVSDDDNDDNDNDNGGGSSGVVVDESERPSRRPYSEWARSQIPRALTGIGDVLSHLGRHADAADAYTRALAIREAEADALAASYPPKGGGGGGLDLLTARRRVVEANVLVAEELMACPAGRDVVTTETGDVLVKAGERVEYARGYYDKARDGLQEAVFLMGKLAAGGADISEQKEDVCYLATMVMGVGTALAEIDDDDNNSEAGRRRGGRATKKAKTG